MIIRHYDIGGFATKKTLNEYGIGIWFHFQRKQPILTIRIYLFRLYIMVSVINLNKLENTLRKEKAKTMETRQNGI